MKIDSNAAVSSSMREQLIDDGYCLFSQIISDQMIKELRNVTDVLLDQQTDEEKEHNRLTGSMIQVWKDDAMAKLIAMPVAFDAMRCLGFKNPKWQCDGYIISKPPRSPALFWHQDWAAWDEPISYTKTPAQLFLMYYLVDTCRNNGCLRVIPGSHRNRHKLHDLAPVAHTEKSRDAQEGNPAMQQYDDEIDIEVRAGDLVVGDARLFHAAHPNQSAQKRTLIILWYCPLFDEMPNAIKAYAIQDKPPCKPVNWSEEAWQMLAPVMPVYHGNAKPARWNRTPDHRLV